MYVRATNRVAALRVLTSVTGHGRLGLRAIAFLADQSRTGPQVQ
jgi:hypothetical protein